MAIFYLSVKPISRRLKPSIIKYIASLTGTKMYDERLKKNFDYKKKTKGVITPHSFSLGFNLIYRADMNSEKLWNLADAAETRSNSRVAREIRVIVPDEVKTKALKIKLVNAFTLFLSKQYGTAVQVVLHAPHAHNDERVYHAHFLMSTREIVFDENGKVGFGRKSILEWSGTQLKKAGLPSSKDELKFIRQKWAEFVNAFLLSSECNERVDARSYVEQGLKILPKLKLNAYDLLLERNNIKTLRGDYNRQVDARNAAVLALEQTDERQTAEMLEITDTFIETYRTAAEITDRHIVKINKFTARSYQTDKFLEKCYQQTAATDRAINQFMRAAAG